MFEKSGKNHYVQMVCRRSSETRGCRRQEGSVDDVLEGLAARLRRAREDAVRRANAVEHTGRYDSATDAGRGPGQMKGRKRAAGVETSEKSGVKGEQDGSGAWAGEAGTGAGLCESEATLWDVHCWTRGWEAGLRGVWDACYSGAGTAIVAWLSHALLLCCRGQATVGSRLCIYFWIVYCTSACFNEL